MCETLCLECMHVGYRIQIDTPNIYNQSACISDHVTLSVGGVGGAGFSAGERAARLVCKHRKMKIWAVLAPRNEAVGRA